jgi:hypothetical protein
MFRNAWQSVAEGWSNFWNDIANAVAYLQQTASLVEWIWLICGLFCLIVDAWMLYDLYRDRDRLQNDGMNGGDNILIVTYIGMNWILAIVHSGVVGIGISFAVRLPVNPSQPVTVGSLILTFWLVLIATATAAGSLWLRYRRHLIRAYLIARFKQYGRLQDMGESTHAEPA